MRAMTVFLPDDIEEHEGDIRYFVDSMVRKLSACSYKGWVSKDDSWRMRELIDKELEELEVAMRTESQFSAFMEAVDTANMALLTGVAVSKQTRQEFDESKNHG